MLAKTIEWPEVLGCELLCRSMGFLLLAVSVPAVPRCRSLLGEFQNRLALQFHIDHLFYPTLHLNLDQALCKPFCFPLFLLQCNQTVTSCKAVIRIPNADTCETITSKESWLPLSHFLTPERTLQKQPALLVVQASAPQIPDLHWRLAGVTEHRTGLLSETIMACMCEFGFTENILRVRSQPTLWGPFPTIMSLVSRTYVKPGHGDAHL